MGEPTPTLDPVETDGTIEIPEETPPLGEASPTPTATVPALPVTGENDMLLFAFVTGIPLVLAGIFLMRRKRKEN